MAKDQHKLKRAKRQLRHRRVRTVVSGTPQKPRLSVFRSGQHIYAQLIDDTKGVTIAAASDLNSATGSKSSKASEVGKRVAETAIKAGITEVRFDRGGYKYHGRIKALAESAREAGLKF